MEEESSNKRVAKNTLILYMRMVVTMAIGIWTSRLVLNALGFTDQGLYNVVGGFIGFLSLLTSSIGGSISRYITFCIGEEDFEKANRTVRNALSVQLSLAVVLFLLSETVGFWFVNNKLVIPADRLFAVNVVYQFAICNIIVGLITGAPIALVIAHERMNIFAYVSIVNALASLCIALSITYSSGDKLILYAGLQFAATLCTFIFYAIYVLKSFRYVKLGLSFDRDIFWPIFSFAGWNGIGTSASILRNSGTSVLLNMFGGPIANTINGIANSANSLVTIFVNDFTTAYRPQIIKRYAAAEYKNLIPFISQCAKFTFGLLLVMAVPVFLNIQPLLIIWLKNVPEGTATFARLIIIISLIESISSPLVIAKNATGDIKNYQLIVGGILLLTLPITYVFLKMGSPIYFAYVSILITCIAAFVARMVMLRGAIPYWSSYDFLRTIVFRCLGAMILSFSLPFALHIMMPDDVPYVLLQCAAGFIWSCSVFYLVGCDKHEKIVLGNMVRRAMNKLLHRDAKP